MQMGSHRLRNFKHPPGVSSYTQDVGSMDSLSPTLDWCPTEPGICAVIRPWVRIPPSPPPPVDVKWIAVDCAICTTLCTTLCGPLWWGDLYFSCPARWLPSPAPRP